MELWASVTWWFLFSVWNSILYWVYYQKHEVLSDTLPIYIYISKINNRLVFKITDRYKFVLQTAETMKLFGSTKINTQNKEWIKYPKSWSSGSIFSTMQFSRQQISTKVWSAT